MAAVALRVSRAALSRGGPAYHRTAVAGRLSPGASLGSLSSDSSTALHGLAAPRAQSLGAATNGASRRSGHLGYASSATTQSEGTDVSSRLGLSEGEVPTWEIRMLHDGDCPLCEREVDMLKRRDAGKGKIDFVDISSDNYSPEQNMGLEYEVVMESIHGILPDGKVISGVEVFRRLYEAVGLGWVYAITKNPTVGAVAENVYNFWARNRMAVTGRPDLEVILSQRKTCREVGTK